MSVKSVKATINGQTYTLTYNGTSGKYEATLTAPTITSYNQPGGYYGVKVEATDEAGNITTLDGTNTSNRLVVKENVPPTISSLSPSSGARVTSAGPKITGKLTDETNGSGVDTSTFELKVDGVAVSNAGVVFSPVSGGFTFEYQASGLEQGNHTFTVNVSDHDGNVATQKSVTFSVDTIAPSLNVSSPADGVMTNQPSINVVGTTSDVTSSPVTVSIKANGVDQGAVTIGENGNFTKSVALQEGANTITVVVTDSSGLTTTVERNVTLDTAAPSITNIELIPNPVDAGATYIIKVTATD
jgi:Glucodextranase, domain B/Bacterial Ig-like domain